jgi:hypothetical protein
LAQFKKILRASEKETPEPAKARADWKEGRQPIKSKQFALTERAGVFKSPLLRGLAQRLP